MFILKQKVASAAEDKKRDLEKLKSISEVKMDPKATSSMI